MKKNSEGAGRAARIVLYIFLLALMCAFVACEIIPLDTVPHDSPYDPDNAEYIGPDLPVAELTGTPDSETYAASISVTVGGTDIVAYKYSLDGGAYSEETTVATPITASGLTVGAHTLSVLGKNSADLWQWESRATTYGWTVLEITDTTPPASIDIDAFAQAYYIAGLTGVSLDISWGSQNDQVLIVRSLSEVPSDLPEDRTEYSVGTTIGDSLVVYAGEAVEAAFSDTVFASDGTWYYRAFACDEFYNYAAGGTQRSIIVYKDAVYVSYTGNDATGNGTSVAPMRTIQGGITKADVLADIHAVRVAGTDSYTTYNYTSATTTTPVVDMISGISVYGGYSPTDWAETARDPGTHVSYIGFSADYTAGSGNCVTVNVYDIQDEVVIDGFMIEGGDASGAVENLYSVYAYGCEGAVTISDCVITGGEVDTAGETSAVFADTCSGGITVSGCAITGGINTAGGATYGININDCPVVIDNNQRIWGGSTPGGISIGIFVNNPTNYDDVTISGNNTGIDCIATSGNIIGTYIGIQLFYCGNVLLENNNVMSAHDGTASAEPRALKLSVVTEAIIRNCRFESAATGTVSSYCLDFNGIADHTVRMVNCHIVASCDSPASGITTSGIWGHCPNLYLYNNNIVAGPGGSSGMSCGLFLNTFSGRYTRLINNNFCCIAGALNNYGIYEDPAATGVMDELITNNFIYCSTALYHDASGTNYNTTTLQAETWADGNIAENGVVLDSNGYATAGESLIAGEGTDCSGSTYTSTGSLTTDKDGAARTGNAIDGWSIGPYEYD